MEGAEGTATGGGQHLIQPPTQGLDRLIPQSGPLQLPFHRLPVGGAARVLPVIELLEDAVQAITGGGAAGKVRQGA